jgi:AAA+ ATPase superfamily predicted ATPase
MLIDSLIALKNNCHYLLAKVLQETVKAVRSICLNTLQEKVLRRTWEGKTYAEIAEETYHDPDYIKRIGSGLWKLLSEALGETVNKKNIHVVIQRKNRNHCKYDKQRINISSIEPQSNSLNSHNSTSIEQHKAIAKHQDWQENIDVSMFYGRTKEIATLNKWIVQDRCRLITLLGIAGVGKTALAVKVVKQIENEFKYVIWRSLRNQPSFSTWLAEIILFFSPQKDFDRSQTIDAQLSYLMTYLRQYRCLLILDNTESILQSGQPGGKYLQDYQGYGQLLRLIQDEQHQSCLLITSSEKPTGLSVREGKNSSVRSLKIGGLSRSKAQKILNNKNIFPAEKNSQHLVDYYAGNPLALKIVAVTIESLFAGDVTAFLPQGTIIFGDIWQLLDRQFQRLSNLEQQIMYCLAVNRESTTLRELQQNLTPTVSYRELLETLESLQGRSPIESTSEGFIQQPLVLEYTLEKLTVSQKLDARLADFI